MDVYRIEKSRTPVIVTLASGEELPGDIFVQGFAESHYGPERTSDILNDRHDFFPVAASDGGTLLLNKAAVRDVTELGAGGDESRLVPTWQRQQVEIRMSDGFTLSGAVELELPGDHPRLLDYLNRTQLRFLAVVTADSTRLLNRHFISSIRLLD